MQNFNNETPKKIYGEIKEHKDGIFTRFFKKKTGLSPKEFRRKFKEHLWKEQLVL